MPTVPAHPRRERPYGDLVFAHYQGGSPRFRIKEYFDDRPGYSKQCSNPRGAVNALRLAAQKFAGTRCAYGVRCRGADLSAATVDHVVARDGSEGQHQLSNLLIACDACNSNKGRKSVEQWLRENGVADLNDVAAA